MDVPASRRGSSPHRADALAGAGVSASIGCSIRDRADSLHASVRAADAEMYERKRYRSAGRRGDARR